MSLFIFATGYNSKLGKNGDHLNPYLLSDIIKTEIQNALDTATQSKHGKTVRKPVSQALKTLKLRRKNAMIDIRDHNTDLSTYMLHMGTLSEKYDKRTKEVSSHLNQFFIEHFSF